MENKFKKMRTSQCLLLTLTAIFLSTLMTGCSTEQAQTKVPVTTQDTTTKKATIEVFGKVLADEKLTLSLSESIKIEKIMTQEGQLVKKNEPILAFDVKALKAKKQVQQELLKVAQATTTDSELLLKKINSELTYNQNVLQQATEQYEKNKKLYEAGALPKEDLTKSLLSLQKAQTDVSVSQLDVSRILKENEKKLLEQSRTYSEIQNTEVQLASVLSNSKDIQNGYIVSRFEKGVMSKLNVSAGKFVPAGESLFELLNLNSRYILAEVPEEFISKVTIGMPVEITPTAQKDKIYKGTVKSIWHTSIDKNGETMIPVRITLEDYEQLLPNYNVDIRFIL